MTETPHVTGEVGLAQQLHELARANLELREQLAEKEKTNQVLVSRIVELQRELAMRLPH